MKLDAADIKVNITQNYTKYDIAASNSLQLGGQNGASITGTIQGASGNAAVTKVGALLGGATGTFLINGCTINSGGGGICPSASPASSPAAPSSPVMPPAPPVNPVIVDKNLVDQSSAARTKIILNNIDEADVETRKKKERLLKKHLKIDKNVLEEDKFIRKVELSKFLCDVSVSSQLELLYEIKQRYCNE